MQKRSSSHTHRAELDMAWHGTGGHERLAAAVSGLWPGLPSSFCCAERALGDGSPCHLHGAVSTTSLMARLMVSCARWLSRSLSLTIWSLTELACIDDSMAREVACDSLLHLDGIDARPKVQGAHGLLVQKSRIVREHNASHSTTESSTWLPQGFS